MSKLIKRGVIESATMLVIGGKKYYSSYSISPNYRSRKSSLHDKTELSRLWHRIGEEPRDTIVMKGVTYYHIDLNDKGW